MAFQFRNVDVSPSDDVTTWPYEALVTVMERGLLSDWQRVFVEIRRQPWGPVARRVERIAASTGDAAAGRLFLLAVERARHDAERGEREAVAAKVCAAIAASGLTAGDFASRVGTSASRLSTYATGKVMPSAARLLRIGRQGRRAAGAVDRDSQTSPGQ